MVKPSDSANTLEQVSRDLGPRQVLCDKAYGGENNCQAAQQRGVEIISPVMGTAEKTL
jgi:hypothetical protein